MMGHNPLGFVIKADTISFDTASVSNLEYSAIVVNLTNIILIVRHSEMFCRWNPQMLENAQLQLLRGGGCLMRVTQVFLGGEIVILSILNSRR
jgi:hypothetical protein